MTHTYRDQYRAYLQTPGWRAKRSRVFARADGMCERCQVGNECDHVHHLSYQGVRFQDGKVKGTEDEDRDLACYCADCHRFAHGLSDLDPKSYGEDWVSYL